MFLKEILHLVEYLSLKTPENPCQLMPLIKRQSIYSPREAPNVCSLENDLKDSKYLFYLVRLKYDAQSFI